MVAKDISADFPFQSKYVEIAGSNIHYIDEGSGDPILFLHGNPTSCYVWRNIIPYLVPHGRCLAPDLIGMGKSDKPDLAYRFFDHLTYVEGFIEKLGLSHLTLVIQDWGSVLGFHYAMRHESNIKGLAFMEAGLKPLKWKDFAPDFRMAFRLFRTPGIGWLMISVMNMLVRKILPQATVRTLSEEEMNCYAAPYKTVHSRKPLRQWPCEIPIEGKPADVHEVVTNYHQKLQESEVPKLLFFATPGGLIPPHMVEWCRHHLKNLTVVDIGEGIHFVQEDHPHLIGEELAKWYRSL